MLALLNNHPRDCRISFEESAHKYTIDDTKSDYISVTSFIKKFFNEFDADFVIERMQMSGSFEKKYAGKTAEQVKREWKQSGECAAARGSRLHKFIERFYNGIETRAHEVEDLAIEISMFYEFFSSLDSKLIPFRTEWYIFDESYGLAGSIDMVYRVEGAASNVVALYDWKCSKEIRFSTRFERARTPISHLYDCNGIHYSLQLNLYKFILEKNYGLNVVSMYLVVLHNSASSYSLVKVKDMQDCIIKMITTIVKP